MGVTYAISPSRWEAPRALACCRCVPTAAVLSVLQAGAAGVAGKVRREPFDRTSCLVAPSGQISPLAKRPSCSTQPGDVGFVFSACRLHFKCANFRSLTSATFYLASFEPPHYELLLLLSFLSPRQEKCRSATTVCDSDYTSPRRAFCVCSEGEMPCSFYFSSSHLPCHGVSSRTRCRLHWQVITHKLRHTGLGGEPAGPSEKDAHPTTQMASTPTGLRWESLPLSPVVCLEASK